MACKCQCIICDVHRTGQIDSTHKRYQKRDNGTTYVVVDTQLDAVICYGYKSEDIDEVIRAMNAQNQRDNKA